MTADRTPHDPPAEPVRPDPATSGPDTAPTNPAGDPAAPAVRDAPTARVYPLPDRESDTRFCFGLIADLADVLTDYDYPRPEPLDFVDLMQAIYRFLYRPHD